MSFYPLYQHVHVISPAVRGLARLIEGGKWINWFGDGGAWRDLTPPMEDWDESQGIRGLRMGRTLRFSRYDRDVNWPKESFGEGYPLSDDEKEYLYAIYERVYVIPERERAAKAAQQEKREREQAESAWLGQLERAGREVAA